MLQAVSGVSMDIAQGSITSLLGANGSGKSTILKGISGLKKLSSGEIWFNGQKINDLPPHRLVKLGIAHVPEGKGLFPYMSVADNLGLGAYVRNDKAEIKQDTKEMLEHFPILKIRSNKQARFLSGGEQETLVIARALMTKPKLLLLDEPLQGIAPIVQEEIANIVLNLNKETGLSIFVVEHNVNMALKISHDVYILETGKVILHGTPQELTKTEYVQKIYLAG
jgi:branched-chain amino acid transport system ATP-binding protein